MQKFNHCGCLVQMVIVHAKNIRSLNTMYVCITCVITLIFKTDSVSSFLSGSNTEQSLLCSILRREFKMVVLFQLTWPLGHVSYCHHFSSVARPSTFHILIFSSETTGPIATKLWWNGPWMAPFQLPAKMAAKLKIEKRGDEILIVHCCFSVSQNQLKF